MDEKALREQLEIGKQAEDFKNYTNENPYFSGMLERIKLTLAQYILTTPPGDTEKFRALKIRYDAIGDIIDAVNGDIAMGGEALRMLENREDSTVEIL